MIKNTRDAVRTFHGNDLLDFEVVEKKHLFGWCWYRHTDKQVTVDGKDNKRVGFK